MSNINSPTVLTAMKNDKELGGKIIGLTLGTLIYPLYGSWVGYHIGGVLGAIAGKTTRSLDQITKQLDPRSCDRG